MQKWEYLQVQIELTPTSYTSYEGHILPANLGLRVSTSEKVTKTRRTPIYGERQKKGLARLMEATPVTGYHEEQYEIEETRMVIPQEAFNKLGEDGWELVGFASASYHEGTTTELIAVFKRPKP